MLVRIDKLIGKKVVADPRTRNADGTLHHHEYGKWSGYLNGASHKNVGKPMLIADIETIKRREEINKDPEKFILDALSK